MTFAKPLTVAEKERERHFYLEYVASQNFPDDPVLLMEESKEKKLNKSKKET